MKMSVLYISGLFLFTMFIFSSFSTASRGRRASYDMARKLAERGNIDPIRENHLKQVIERIQEEDPEFTLTFESDFDVRQTINGIYRRFLDTTPREDEFLFTPLKDTPSDNQTYYSHSFTPPYISIVRAETIAEVLIDKVGEQALTTLVKTDLVVVITTPKSYSRVGESLLELAKKVDSVQLEDMVILLTFANNIRNIRPKGKDNEPSDENILLDLAKNLHKIPFYESAHDPPEPGLLRLDVDRLDTEPLNRDQLMRMLVTFNTKLGSRATQEDTEILPYLNTDDIIRIPEALNIALVQHIINREHIAETGLVAKIRGAKTTIYSAMDYLADFTPSTPASTTE